MRNSKIKSFFASLMTGLMLFNCFEPCYVWAQGDEEYVDESISSDSVSDDMDKAVSSDLIDEEDAWGAKDVFMPEEVADDQDEYIEEDIVSSFNDVEWQEPSENWYEAYAYTLNETDKTISLGFAKSSLEGNIVIPATADINGKEYAVILGCDDTLKQCIWKNCSDSITGIRVLDGVKAYENCNRMFLNMSSLTMLDISGLDTGNVMETYLMFSGCDKLEKLDISNFDLSKVEEMSLMFSDCAALTELDLKNVDTSSAKWMVSVFYGCKSLKTLDLSSFNTSNVEDMAYMFGDCGNLEELDLSGFDISKVTDTLGMFMGCSKLTELDLSNFDTSNVENMSGMFQDCKSLKSIGLSSFDTSNVKDMGQMFCNNSSLQELDLSSFETGSVSDMSCMFYGCSNLNRLDLRNFDTGKVRTMAKMFDACSKLEYLDVSSFDTSKVTDMDSMFSECSVLKELDLSNFDTSAVEGEIYDCDTVTGMRDMFRGCKSLTSLDLSSFDTSKVLGMGCMFYDCSALEYLDVSSFNTASVVDMTEMFRGCSSLTELDLKKFNNANATRMAGVFSGCSSLQELDLSGFKTPKAESLSMMFCQCSNLKRLDLSGFDTSNVYDMSWMFIDCYSLSVLDVRSFDTSKVLDMSMMINNCSSLKKLDIRNFTIREDCDTTAMVSHSARNLYLPVKWVRYYDFREDSRLKKIYYAGSDSEWYTLSNPVDDGLNVIKNYTEEIDLEPDEPKPVDSWVEDFIYYPEDDMLYLTKAKNTLSGDVIIPATVKAEKDFVYKVVLGNVADDAKGMWDDCKHNIKSIVINEGVIAAKDCSALFGGLDKMEYADISGLDTSRVSDMNSMFWGCSELTEIKIAGIDTSHVVDMASMFVECSKLEAIDLSGFDTSNVTDMSNMFRCCESIKELDLSSLRTQNVKDMNYMFYLCYALKKLNISGFDTGNVTNMSGMFLGCSGLRSLDVSGFNTANVKDMSFMFRGTLGLTNLDLRCFVINDDCDIESIVLYTAKNLYLPIAWRKNFAEYIWGDYRYLRKIYYEGTEVQWDELNNTVPEYVQLIFNYTGAAKPDPSYPVDSWCEDFDYYIDENILYINQAKETLSGDVYIGSTATAEDGTVYKVVLGPLTSASSGMWMDCRDNITSIKLQEGLKVSSDCTELFSGCDKITRIDMNGVDMSALSDLSRMFANCDGLESVSFNSVKTGHAENMSGMFYNCMKLKKIDMSGIDTSKVSDMSHMFGNCRSLEELDLRCLDTSGVRIFSGMFSACINLKELDISSFDTVSATDMHNMFFWCEKLTKLDVSKFITDNVTDMSGMFRECKSITEFDLSSFNTSKVTNMKEMFDSCFSLEKLNVSSFDTSAVESFNSMFRNCSSIRGLNVSSFNTSNAEDMSCMFASCYQRDLDIRNLIINKNCAVEKMISGCGENIFLPVDWIASCDLTDNNMLEKIYYAGTEEQWKALNNIIPERVEVIFEFTGEVPSHEEQDIIHVTDVFISDLSLVMSVGEVYALDVYINPGNATDKSVSWTSSAPGVAMVDDNGIVTAVSSGDAAITVKTNDGGYTATCMVRVNPVVLAVTGVSVSPDSVELTVGETKELTATVTPEDATDKSVNWSSSKPAVAAVNANGKVTAVSAGTATITVTTTDGGYAAACVVTVKEATVSENTVSVNGVTLSDAVLELEEGEIKKLTATVTPEDATDKSVSWSSSEPSVAIVYANGTVAAVSAGTAMITVTTTDGGYTAACIVTVKEATVSENTVSVNGVTLSDAVLELVAGETKTLTATVMPEDATDKSISWGSSKASVATVDANGTVTAVSAGTATITVTTMDGGFTANCVVTVKEAAVSENTISVNGVILSDTALKLKAGETKFLTATVTPDNATDKSVSWCSSKTSVATIDADGTVTAVSVGETTITVTTTDGGFTASCVVTVEKAIPDVISGNEAEPVFFFDNGTEKLSVEYTGSTVKPHVNVYLGSEMLTEGDDYSLKYEKNTNAGTAVVTITGKGRFSGRYVMNFTILPKSIGDEEGNPAEGIVIGGLIVKGKGKVKPVIAYNGKILGSSDYSVSIDDSDEDMAIVTVTAKGKNFTGSIKNLEVTRINDSKEYNQSVIKVKLDKVTRVYDGTPKLLEGELTVSDKEGEELTEGVDYELCYSADTVNAGTVKVNIIGIGDHTGKVTKNYKIAPAEKDSVNVSLVAEEGKEAGHYSFIKNGVMPKVILTAVVDGETVTLTEGEDYNVSYSRNKMTGDKAAAVIKLKGNYKGFVNKNFTVDKAGLAAAEVLVGDLLYTKAAKYKSVPVVILNGEVIDKSEYTVSYINGNDKITFGADETERIITLEITGKNHYEGDVLTASYRVYKAGKTDITKAKIYTVEKGGTKKKSKMAYTGRAITFDPKDDERQADICIKIGKKVLTGAEVFKYFDVNYTDNINIGKETIILTAKDKLEDGGENPYSGMKTGTCSITKKKLK